jgi:hypothetical protein
MTNQIPHAVDLISAPNSPYDQHMNQPTRQQHPTGPVATDGPPAQQQPLPPYPGFYPVPPQQNRQWVPVAIVAAIVVAGGLIAGAIMLSGGNKAQPPTAARGTTAPAASVPAESTATCKAWNNTYTELMAVPPLPDGADYNTPNIDTLIANQNKANEKALIGFEPKIAPDDPTQVVNAAKAYINAKRIDMAKSASHTVTEADDTAVDTSFATLNQLCNTVR